MPSTVPEPGKRPARPPSGPVGAVAKGVRTAGALGRDHHARDPARVPQREPLAERQAPPRQAPCAAAEIAGRHNS